MRVSAGIATIVVVLARPTLQDRGLAAQRRQGLRRHRCVGALPARLRAQGTRLEALVRSGRTPGIDGARLRGRRCLGYRHRASWPLRRAGANRGRASLSGLVRRRRWCVPLTPAARLGRQRRSGAARRHLGRHRRDDRSVPRRTDRRRRRGSRSRRSRSLAADDGAGEQVLPLPRSLAGSASTQHPPARHRRHGRS